MTPKGQYTITVPRKLALAKGLVPGQEGEWTITKDGKLRLEL